MTKTYNDIEAVNRLLEEKERDLELAAKIGQTLLTKNQDLAEKNEALEEQLCQVTEKVNQLKHELIMKDGLIQAFTENVDLSPSSESCGSTEGLHTLGTHSLQKKVENLEAENIKLRMETAQLTAETSDLEEKEQKLMEDCLGQLGSVKQELEMCVEELSKKTDECGRQKEEITSLLAQIVEMQKRTKVLTAENMEYQKHLEASQDSQRRLTKEVAELKDKHDELLQLYEEAQEEIRELRRKQKPSASKHNYMSASLTSLQTDSLASELESSLRGDVEYPRGYSPAERKVHSWKVFETVKAVKKTGSSRGSSLAGSRYSLRSAGSSMRHLAPPSEMSSQNLSGAESGGESGMVSHRSSMYFSEDESINSDGYSGDVESVCRGSNQAGHPGVPGTRDLEAALRKLSLRRANELNELDYREEEERRQRHESEGDDTPRSCRTPDSTLSTGSGFSQFSLSSSNNPYFRLPEKLRIIKPLEGSVTLRRWQQLATPNMTRVLETRPGIQTKGERKLDIEEETYNLSDLEEDDDYVECPSKRFENSHTINTYTNSTIKHPSTYNRTSETVLTSTPRIFSSASDTSHGTSTFSMSLGLAAILNERDLITSSSDRQNGDDKNLSNTANPTRVSSIISDTHFDLSKSKTAALYTTSVSTGGVQLSTQVSPSKSLPKIDLKTSGNANQNVLFDALKHTGASLYGYLGTWANRQDGLPQKVTENLPAVTPACSIAQQSADSSIANGGVTVISSESERKTKASLVKGILSKASAGGLVGALRDNGLI